MGRTRDLKKIGDNKVLIFHAKMGTIKGRNGIDLIEAVDTKKRWQEYTVKVKVKSLSRVRLFATPWTVAYQACPSIRFSRQGYWSGVPLPSPNKAHN